MKRLKQKKVAALLVIALLALTTVGAYAYFTNSGQGTGSAAVGSSSQITLAGTITGTLYPAGDAASVSVLVTNPGSGSQHVGSVTLAGITTNAGHSTCDLSVGAGPANAFTMADIVVNTTLTKTGTAGDHTTVVGSLQMNDTGLPQDACQGAPLTLHFASN